MFKSFRRYYWVSQGFLARHSQIIIRTVLIVLSFVLIFFLFARYIPSPKHTLRIGRVGKYNLETFPQDIQSLISQGLVSITSNGAVLPELAKSYEIKDDGKTYIFTLDDSKRWHNGERVTPPDITYNFKGVTVELGDNTVTYHLKEPFSPFLSAVSRPILKNSKLGTGAYHLAKSEVYSGVLQSLSLESESERRIYKFYPTETSSLTAFKLGEIDILERLSALPSSITQDSTTQVDADKTGLNQQTVLFFNNNDSLLTSKPMRQALAYAIKDKSFGKERVFSPLDKSSWAYNGLVKTYDYDASHAKTLLAQDVKDLGSVKLELKTMLQYLDNAEAIAQSWRDTLGVQVEVKVVSSVTSDYQILLADFTPPVDPDQYSLWHSTQATNFTHYSNLKVDKLLEDGRRTSDQKLRKEIYSDFQRFLLEDSPAVFLFKSNTYTLSRKSLL